MNRFQAGPGATENSRVKKLSAQFNGPVATAQSKPAQLQQQKLKTTITANQETPAQHVSC